MFTLEQLDQLLARFPGQRLGLLGDLFLDRYLDIDPELRELSIETGLEAYQVTRVRNNPGALGTIINNLAALGVGRLVPLTVLGDDGEAYDLLQALGRLPVDVSHVLRDPTRRTPTYTKPMRRDEQLVWRELNRFDLRNRSTLSAATEEETLRRLETLIEDTDALIVLDQVNEEGWGVVTPRVRQRLAELVARGSATRSARHGASGAPRNCDKLVFIDSRAHLARFTAGVLKPNRAECLKAAGQPADADDAAVSAAAATMAQRTGQPVFCTLGQQGILVQTPGGPSRTAPAVAVRGPIDTVGAGDSVTAGIVASLVAGASPFEAAQVGNLVASVTIQQLGTTGACTPAQLRTRASEAL